MQVEIHSLKMRPGNLARSIAAFSREVWVLSIGSSWNTEEILHSTNSGAVFTPLPFGGDCVSGGIKAASKSSLWISCSTGNMGHLLISSDGAKTFLGLASEQGTQFANGIPLLALSPTSAVASRYGDILWTSDSGKAWHTGTLTDGAARFSLSDDGATLFAVVTANETHGTSLLWVSVDQGHHWHLA